MPRKKPIILTLLLIVALFFSTRFAHKRLEHNRSINTKVWALLDPDYQKQQTALSELAQVGPAAYPQLRRAFREKYFLSERAYDLATVHLPAPLNSCFPARPSRAQLRTAAAASLYALGPNASRALLPEVELTLNKADDYESMVLLQSLLWSIPESPRAVQILSNYLANPKPGKLLFGTTDARELWPHVRHLAPLLRPWLYFRDTTAEAAEALGLMGTNAASALPDLMTLAASGTIPDPTIHSQYLKGGPINRQRDPAERNRAAAIYALGEIGIATPELLEVLKKSYVDPSERIRSEAALAFASLGARSLPAIDFLIEKIDRSNTTVLQYQLLALGRMGTNATKAIPLLVELSSSSQLSFFDTIGRSAPKGAPTGLHRTFLWQNEPRPGMIAAAGALLQIDPISAGTNVDVLALALRNLVPSDFVRALRPFKNDLLPQLEPALHIGQPLGTLRPPFGPPGMPIHRIVVAHHILVLDPKNAPARALFQTAMKDQDPRMRSLAAKWLYLATGEIDTTLPVVRESLSHVKTEEDQVLLMIVSDFGENAASLAPTLEPFLLHPAQAIRFAAGRALRSISAIEKQ